MHYRKMWRDADLGLPFAGSLIIRIDTIVISWIDIPSLS